MKIKKYTYIMLAVLLFSGTACSDFLDKVYVFPDQMRNYAMEFWIKNMMQPFQMKRCLLIRL